MLPVANLWPTLVDWIVPKTYMGAPLKIESYDTHAFAISKFLSFPVIGFVNSHSDSQHWHILSHHLSPCIVA